MNTSLFIWSTALIILLVVTAAITDLLWRRIPNVLTLPAIGLGLLIRIVFQGWPGLGLALAGCLIAPIVLLILHGGKGLGMGDIKLAAAVGTIFGPVLGVATMLVSAVAGGVLGVVMLLRSSGMIAQMLRVFIIGLPFLKKKALDDSPNEQTNSTVLTMPYGIAIGAGSLLTLAVCWWTGHETWILSYVTIAARQ